MVACITLLVFLLWTSAISDDINDCNYVLDFFYLDHTVLPPLYNDTPAEVPSNGYEKQVDLDLGGIWFPFSFGFCYYYTTSDWGNFSVEYNCNNDNTLTRTFHWDNLECESSNIQSTDYSSPWDTSGIIAFKCDAITNCPLTRILWQDVVDKSGGPTTFDTPEWWRKCDNITIISGSKIRDTVYSTNICLNIADLYPLKQIMIKAGVNNTTYMGWFTSCIDPAQYVWAYYSDLNCQNKIGDAVSVNDNDCINFNSAEVWWNYVSCVEATTTEPVTSTSSFRSTFSSITTTNADSTDITRDGDNAPIYSVFFGFVFGIMLLII